MADPPTALTPVVDQAVPSTVVHAIVAVVRAARLAAAAVMTSRRHSLRNLVALSVDDI